MESIAKPPKGRLFAGSVVFVSGFLSPALIPVVLSTNLSPGFKTTLTGLLAIGIPELFMVIAAAILGKEGFSWLKQKIGSFFKRYGPPDQVSKVRYRIGLFMFVIPLILAWGLPYFGHHIPFYETNKLWFFITGDLMFILSFFVLGGDFWGKIRSLFIYNE